MSRRKKKTPDPEQLTPDYWVKFLEMQNLSGFITEETLVKSVATDITLPKDPIFIEFLKVASRYGAPKNMEEFKKLDETNRKYYLRAYQIYLQEKKKMTKKG